MRHVLYLLQIKSQVYSTLWYREFPIIHFSAFSGANFFEEKLFKNPCKFWESQPREFSSSQRLQFRRSAYVGPNYQNITWKIFPIFSAIKSLEHDCLNWKLFQSYVHPPFPPTVLLMMQALGHDFWTAKGIWTQKGNSRPITLVTFVIINIINRIARNMHKINIFCITW
jgi:hypothetical protein